MPENDPIPKLKTPEECATFAENAAQRKRPDLALRAKKRAIELRAATYGATTDAERECIQAVCAYEQTLAVKNGRRQSASRTWPMLERHGIIGAVERVVARKEAAAGYNALVELGMQEYAFESVILRYPHLFSAEAVERSRARIGGASDA
jgi:hypothetical protein